MGEEGGGKPLLPIVSTMPVNMVVNNNRDAIWNNIP